MSLASLEAFLEQADKDVRLQERLLTAPDAAAVATIAQEAGFPVSELDLWQASGASPEEMLAVPPAPPARAASTQPFSREESAEAQAGGIPDPWLDDDAIGRFLHQAEGDEALQEALASAPDAAAVAAIAQAAGYPITELDLWRASAATPEELTPAELELPVVPEKQVAEPRLEPTPAQTAWTGSSEEALLGFLHQAQGDEALQQALASAPDAESVAAIASAAGYPISPLDLWRASGGSQAEDLLPIQPDLSPLEAPLARFLLEAEHDLALHEALAVAEDAAAVAAIAQAAGYPITAADLWEATEAIPEELVVEAWVIETFAFDDLEEEGDLA